jgi:hypothetical protein
VRERLIGCIAGAQSPTPLLSERFSQAGTFGWGFLGITCAAALLLMIPAGYAKPYNSSSVQGPVSLVVYVAALFGVVYSVLAVMRRWRLVSTLPFTPGRYLFPMDLVDARTRDVRIIPMSLLADLSAVHHHTNGVYTHTQFTLTFEGGKSEAFVVRSKGEAEGALHALRTSRAAIGEAVKNLHVDIIAGLDPFFEVRVADAWENPPPDKSFDQGPVAGEMPPWLKKAALVALAPAAVLGPIVWYARNRLSDDAMFEDAKAVNSETAFENYLRYGRRHADEVREEYIWKAALADANKMGTSTALEAFLRKYPDSPASKDIAEDKLPRLALKEAQSIGTVSAIRGFMKAHPGSVVEADASAEIHKLFAATLTEFKPQASTADPKMRSFIERLLKYLEEKESPPVLVSFRSIKSPSLELADKLLQTKAPGIPDVPGASLAAVSPHFSDERSQPREAAIVTILQGAFSTIFPADVLPLKQGPRRTEASSKDPVSEPRIEIDYEVSWSGSTYSSETSGREFVGIKIAFQVAMRLPGEPEKEALRFKLNVAPPDHFTVNYFSTPSPFIDQALLRKEGPTDEKVYEVMAARAFDELSVKLRGVFFKEGSEAWKGTGTAIGTGAGAAKGKAQAPSEGSRGPRAAGSLPPL